MNSHTQGPLRLGPINYADIYASASGELVALVFKDRPETVGDALRLVACWNACRCFSTEQIEAGIVARMLETLKLCLETLCDCQSLEAIDTEDILEQVIAQAEGR